MSTQLYLPQCCMQNKQINMNTTEDIKSSIGKGSYAPHQIKEIAHQSQ